MSHKVRLVMPVYASYSVEVEVSDEDYENRDFDGVMDTAYDRLPSGLCYHCSTGGEGNGFGKGSPVYLELNDDAEVHYITGDNGETVWGDPDKKLGW